MYMKASITKDIGIEAEYRAKNFELVIKSYLFEGIFVDAKGVNCPSLVIVLAKKYLSNFFG